MNSLTLRKATRQKTKIRIGLSGPSGSGKTYSAILLASGMAPWDKIALIDTENGSGDLYADLGQYNVITLTAPYSPERYIEAIKACEDAKMEVVIIDSVTHEWDGKGGCLESNELLGQTRFKGNNWAAWSVTTPRHQKFIEAITTSRCHIITTARAKTDTIQTEDKKIKKVGMKEIQREGFEYELTLNFTLDRDGHYATASKDRTGLFINDNPFKITKESGAKILAWAVSGVEPLPEPETPKETGLPKALSDFGIGDPKPESKDVKIPPTADFVVKHFKTCADIGSLNLLYDRAFLNRVWNDDELKTVNGAYLELYAKLKGWTIHGSTFLKNDILIGSWLPGEKGKLIIKEMSPDVPVDGAVASEKLQSDYEAAERAGMQSS